MDEPTVQGPVWIPEAPPSLGAFLSPDLQPVPLIPAIALIAAVLYLAGVVRLWATGRRWPVAHMFLFLLGCAAIMVVTGAGVEGYGLRMFSVFMFQQLTLMITVPPLLVLGRPGTLLLRATPHRFGGQHVLRAALCSLRSRGARFVIHPGFMVPVFLMTFYVLYFSDIADALLPYWLGHVGLELFFLASGILFAVPLLSTGPLPKRQSYVGRLLDQFAEMPLHAFFGVILMMASTPVVDFYAELPPEWGIDPMRDQWLAGGLAWSYGELPALFILLLIMVRWQRDEAATDAREDREREIHGDPDLEAYNSYLNQLGRASH
ncbi:cytochrome c oxidase assembly protein [Janibacter alittae]|uniref:Cytochrome c oxidase assembly protein n=1 Tax=Janibacter alittae TaxID=3115209 RepID=A0ABZ2MLN8_9MICO